MRSQFVYIPIRLISALIFLWHLVGVEYGNTPGITPLNERIATIEVRMPVSRRLPVSVPGAVIRTNPDLGIAYTDGRGITTLYAEEGFFENNDLKCLRISAFHSENELHGEVLITSSRPLSYIEDIVRISLGEYKHLIVHEGKIVRGTDGGHVSSSRGRCATF
ncbi:MAG: hypothetical protein KTR29_07115 [Rhodothermaceae bacterium]|nr:hypothetical protein [Rhodothermaceae bacterium]